MAINTTSPSGIFVDQTFIAGEVVPEALIMTAATQVGSIEGDAPAIRCPFIKADPNTGFVPEGAEIGLDDPTLDEVLIRTAKIAVLTKVSREADSYTTADTLIADSLARTITNYANTAFLTNVPDSKHNTPVGLLNLPDIPDAGVLGADLDTLVDALAGIEAEGGQANMIIVDPFGWAAVRKLKAATQSHLPLVGAAQEQATQQLLGVPVIVNPKMSKGTALVLDTREVLAAVGPINLDVSDQAFFSSDSIARRVTWRIGWNVIRPERLAKLPIPLAPQTEPEPLTSEQDETKD